MTPQIAVRVEGRDGTDTMHNFERVEFQDQTVTMDELIVPGEAEETAAADDSQGWDGLSCQRHGPGA